MTDQPTPAPKQPTPAPPTPPAPVPPSDGRARMLAALRRPGSRGQAAAAVLLAILGFAAVTQVKANGKDDQYVGARQGDLVQYINNLSLASQRTEAEIARLQQTRDALRSDTRSRRTALERARQLYGRVQRSDDFDAWLAGYAQRAVVGSFDEVAERLREYERAGCERVMLQHLLHDDLEPVALAGRLGQELV